MKYKTVFSFFLLFFLRNSLVFASETPVNFEDHFGKIQKNFNEVITKLSVVSRPRSSLILEEFNNMKTSIVKNVTLIPDLSPPEFKRNKESVSRKLNSINQLLYHKISFKKITKKLKINGFFSVKRIRKSLKTSSKLTRQAFFEKVEREALKNNRAVSEIPDKSFDIKNAIIQQKMNKFFETNCENSLFLNLNKMDISPSDVCKYLLIKFEIKCITQFDPPEVFYDLSKKPIAKLFYFFNAHSNINAFFTPLFNYNKKSKKVNSREMKEFDTLLNNVHMMFLRNKNLLKKNSKNFKQPNKIHLKFDLSMKSSKNSILKHQLVKNHKDVDSLFGKHSQNKFPPLSGTETSVFSESNEFGSNQAFQTKKPSFSNHLFGQNHDPEIDLQHTNKNYTGNMTINANF